MTSRCPKCLNRQRVQRLILGAEEPIWVVCNVCETKWRPYQLELELAE